MAINWLYKITDGNKTIIIPSKNFHPFFFFTKRQSKIKHTGTNEKNLEITAKPAEIPPNNLTPLFTKNKERIKKKSETESKSESLANRIVQDENPAKIRDIIGFP